MIGHDILNNIIDKCPTPFYIFDEKAFIHNYKQLEKTLKPFILTIKYLTRTKPTIRLKFAN